MFKIKGSCICLWVYYVDLLCDAFNSVSFIVSPFLQLKWKGKWQPDFFLYVDRLVKVDLSETCFLGHVHYAMETF